MEPTDSKPSKEEVKPADKAETENKTPAPMPFEIKVDPTHDLAGREMAAIAPKVDDGSRQAYQDAKAEAAENTAASSPKMGDGGANSTNPDTKPEQKAESK